jgi:hypothetical protein
MEYAQLVGTIILTNDYREENQKQIEIEESKPIKKTKNKNSFGDKLGQKIFNFFGEDTDLVENNQTNTQV